MITTTAHNLDTHGEIYCDVASYKTPAVLGGIIVAVVGGFNMFQIIIGASRGLQGLGPRLDGALGWILVVTATLSLIGIIQAGRGARRWMNGVAAGSDGMRRGAQMINGMAFCSLLPVAVVIGFPVGVAAFGLMVVLSFATLPIIRGFGA